MFKLGIFMTILCLGASASASSDVPRSTDESDEGFGLYAYGDSVGGLPLFYSEGKAFIGDPTNSTSSTASSVTFSADCSKGWVGNPNGTTKAKADWSDECLYIPSSSSSNHQMGFTSETLSNETTDAFFLYGQWVMVKSDNDDISSSFHIREVSESEGTYSLLWNVTDEDGAVPISLRSTKPSD
ncbi:hypothetical protein N7478_010552 [Penicillium angulare]|uniref:uncharacterized protein n=1 Tax=Penicillium angulare TaxID=116970 RepID=UPI0025419557|nr:uncharacterized protein N7478_010552 [Penicillium angulare]KAJ5267744.1 hypothetical protein N7478_010552 [Penicillium angulare]